MAVVSIGANKVRCNFDEFRGTGIYTYCLSSIDFIQKLFHIVKCTRFKIKKFLFFVAIRYYLLFDQFHAGVILVQVYNMSNSICAINVGCGGDGFRLNATTYFSNVYIMSIK